MLTPTQKKTAQAIVNIFETGTVLGDYGGVTVIPGDTGHLTFGRSQTTLGSGNLSRLLERYCANAGARFAARLDADLPRFAAVDLTLDDDWKVHNTLRASADDPVMREVQDLFFDSEYWQAAERAAGREAIDTPLGLTVVYDSIVHGSWGLIRDRTTSRVQSRPAIDERAWIAAYVDIRRDWLGTHPRRDLRTTIYRIDALQRLIDQGHWGLELPLVVRGMEISVATLSESPPNCYDGPQPGSRTLSQMSPLARGLDVRLLQLGLTDRSIPVVADGVYGRNSVACVREFQSMGGLPVTGVVDPQLFHRILS